MTQLGNARVHSAEAACAAWNLAWESGPGFCFNTPEWVAYDIAHYSHMLIFALRRTHG